MPALNIGTVRLANNLILAPMAGISDRPFRELCRHFGAGMAVAEMVTSDTRLWDSRKSSLRLVNDDDQEPRSIQIAGSEPEQMAEAARGCVALGAQIIDINMGCPAKKVCNKAAGSALLKDELLVAQILHAVVTAVTVPVTLKIRTGWDTENRNALRIARIAEQEGIQALAIHGRTRAERFNGVAEYDTIAAVKQAIGIPVLANGDIDSPQKARFVLEHTGADGLLIGRAARGRPWLFREMGHYLASGELLPPLPLGEMQETLTLHLARMHAFYGPVMGVRIARKHLAWYLQWLPDTGAFRSRFNSLDNSGLQLQAVNELFERLHAQGIEHAA
ncbi:tRNA dihydrouridine synthase DusB [Thiopseudomonas denitrificans]|uniref:tRNA-dihydrouridine synthase B n=1 Tax=Thiopseudomonas denitrificans TaxID=1501432 RepID=A0A4V3D572_9GAMM|nr:tRNA dihydrouridine synthase DusB [Thiopseudomonas denitrificans]TDQ38947.1 tRNA-U20-dihydrouridine synthase [Thiopseudomonas denitrificans]